MDGILNIDTPGGMTSHDVVAQVRRALKTKRVGHAGTLDPDATGVLVIAVGIATRLLPHLPTEPKEYVARIAFGTATDSEDASGTVTREADASRLTEGVLRGILPRFTGEIEQIPPMVSAVHHEGRRLYELAREGVTVDREARKVTVYTLRASDFQEGERAEATLQVSCGGGTYIRTLCADIGDALGLPAHMKALRRDAVGSFARADALPLQEMLLLGTDAIARDWLLPLERALDLPTVAISDDEAVRVSRGQSVDVLLPPARTDAVALLHRERLLAVARYTDGKLLPYRVFTGPMADPQPE
ncbi:MAG: tRNA pseudouridine(55) synthase TruB [Cytophagales bacterium]|nr:tRNA pseudouridine(55) synthase TruB [Armatimonadota bacterium]